MHNSIGSQAQQCLIDTKSYWRNLGCLCQPYVTLHSLFLSYPPSLHLPLFLTLSLFFYLPPPPSLSLCLSLSSLHFSLSLLSVHTLSLSRPLYIDMSLSLPFSTCHKTVTLQFNRRKKQHVTAGTGWSPWVTESVRRRRKPVQIQFPDTVTSRDDLKTYR